MVARSGAGANASPERAYTSRCRCSPALGKRASPLERGDPKRSPGGDEPRLVTSDVTGRYVRPDRRTRYAGPVSPKGEKRRLGESRHAGRDSARLQ